MNGYWQCEKYFKQIESDIKKELRPSDEDLVKLNKIIPDNSVSIHIRKYKYSDQPHELKNNERLLKSEKFTQDLISYVYKGISYFEKKIDKPTFFIWSNDIDSIKKYFNNSRFIFVKGNDVINDFNLFSYAKHFIVGGSTYHWWGAWLNDWPNKICLCPQTLNPSGNINFYPIYWDKI